MRRGRSSSHADPGYDAVIAARSTSTVTAPHTEEVVLLVEDNLDMGESLAEFICATTNVSEVVRAFDGLEALDLLLAGLRPCVIILDWHMPGCDGRAFRVIQLADPELSTIPVILYSADHTVTRLADQLKIEPDHIIAKPIDPRAIVDRLRQHCAL